MWRLCKERFGEFGRRVENDRKREKGVERIKEAPVQDQ